MWPLWKTVWRFLKKLKIELPFDRVITLLGIYPKNIKTLIRRDICMPMFMAALFTIAKLWKQPKCPSIDEWIKKMWYEYIMECYSAIKKNEILPFATTWMDLESIMLTEVSQRKTNAIWFHSCVELKKQNKQAKWIREENQETGS